MARAALPFLLCIMPVLVAGADRNRSWDVLVQTIKPGKSVVVKQMNSIQVEGKLLAIDADSITVRKGRDSRVIRRDDVLRVRYANIRRRNTLIGMAIGAGAGAAIGATQSDSEFGGALIGVGLGALTGGVLPIGAPLYEAEVPARARASTTPEKPAAARP
jgi:hypothetical protein